MAAVGTETFTGTLTVTLDDAALAVAGTVTTPGGGLPASFAAVTVTAAGIWLALQPATVVAVLTAAQIQAGPPVAAAFAAVGVTAAQILADAPRPV
jgi:hypothetical protein